MKARLLELSPRAFEFFAGDFLEYLGLSSVVVTRRSGDGGIDATCEMVSGGLFRVPAGVQMKRQRGPVNRPEMDTFIGALANRFACGIFVATAPFTQASQRKAHASVPHVSTVDGDKLAEVLVTNGIGTRPQSDAIDENYFSVFEEAPRIAERRASYQIGVPQVVTPADDLISLRAFSYALHVDTTTVRDWVERGRLRPDAVGNNSAIEGMYFRRHRVEEARHEFGLRPSPTTSDEWLEGFLRFAMHGKLNKSYKPVMLLQMLDLVRDDGSVDEDALVEAFRDYYLARSEASLLPEVANSPMSRPTSVTLSAVKGLLIRYPLDRFVIQGYVTLVPEAKLIRFRPEVWEGLHFHDVVALRHRLREQLELYFKSIVEGGERRS